MPVPTASATNPATRMSEIRLEIVMVKKSLDAANAITAGKISSLAASISNVVMDPLIASAPATPSPSGVGEIARDVRIHVLQLAADRVDDRDDRHRDPGGDEPVFDRSRAGPIAQESPEDGHG